MNCFNDSTIKNILNIMKCDKDFVLNNFIFFLCWPGIGPYLILGIIAITVMIVLMVMLKFMQTLEKKLGKVTHTTTDIVHGKCGTASMTHCLLYVCRNCVSTGSCTCGKLVCFFFSLDVCGCVCMHNIQLTVLLFHQ